MNYLLFGCRRGHHPHVMLHVGGHLVPAGTPGAWVTCTACWRVIGRVD